MSKNKKIQKHMRDFKHPLKSRRDFLTHGLLAFGAVATLPNFFGFGSKAWASGAMTAGECGGTVGMANGIPFLAFDMAGGASLPGNFLVGKKGGPEDFIQSYSTLGWDPRATGALDKQFGLPMSATYSTMLAGIVAKASAPARLNLRMGSFCHTATFDSTSNPFNAGILALKSGTRGTYITNGTGTVESNTGGNSDGVDATPVYKPVLVNSVNDILSSTSFGGNSFNGFPVAKLKALAQGSLDLGELQKMDYVNTPGGQALIDASTCSYKKTLEFLSGVQGLDPREDAVAQQLYNINQNSGATAMEVIESGIFMNTLDGNCGPSTFTLGDCDYHTGSNTKGDMQDRTMGEVIGRAVELAFRRKKPLFFQIITDGGNAALDNSRNWNADSGDKTMTVIGYYDPAGAPEQIRQQVGSFTNSQGADTTSILGGNSSLIAYAVLANYLNLQGRLAEFNTYAPGVFTGAGELQSVLIFKGKA
jgi:hypothetical protein